jgi:leucyl aminopeptidase
MKMQLATTPWTEATGDWLIVGIPELFELIGPLGTLDQALSGQLSRLRETQDLTGKLAESVSIPAPAGIRAKRLLLIGLGAGEKINDASLHKALMTAARTVSAKKTERIAVAVPSAGPADRSG